MRIDVWSDFACPWCAVGLARLDVARDQFEHGDAIEVVHRAFELNPRAPAHRGLTMKEAVSAKYGISPERVDAGHQQLMELGRQVGVDFQFDTVQLGNTFNAHRLARSARGTVVEADLVRGLFHAYFTEGRSLADSDVLLDVATAAGLDPTRAAAVLAKGEFADEVRADEEEAQQADVWGVPHFLINGRWAIPGAQDVETLVLMLRRAWERLEAPAT